MVKNKFLFLAPLVAVLICIVFSLFSIPTVNPSPKDLPVAIINLDTGVDIPGKGNMNMGKTIIENINKAMAVDPSKASAIKWINLDTYEQAEQGMNKREYYAAFVIPNDFSQKQASLQTQTPGSPELRIVINQGMKSTVAGMLTPIFSQMLEGINTNVRTQIFAGLEAQGAVLTPKQAEFFVRPIASKIEYVNVIGTSSAGGNAPISLFQPMWLASIITSVLLFFAFKKASATNTVSKLKTRGLVLLSGAIASLAVGFGLTWSESQLVGLNIPDFLGIALVISLATFCFFLMISAVMSWVGMGGVGLFALLMFFGAPLLAMPTELMSPFYKDWVYSWLPMRFLVSGLRDAFYFGTGFHFSKDIAILLGIGIVSCLIMFASVWKPESKKKKASA